MVGAQGYQRFLRAGSPGISKAPSSAKLVVGRRIALHAAPAGRANSNYLVSAFPIDSFNFIFPNLLWSSIVECVINSESELYLR